MGIVLAALLPVIVVALVAVWWAANAFRDASTNQLLETARTISQSVRSELQVNSAVFKVLSSDPALKSSDIAARTRRLNEISLQFGGRAIVIDSKASNDGPALGELLAHGVPAGIARDMIGGDGVTYSNLFTPVGGGKPSLAIALHEPSVDGGRRTLVLVAGADRLVRSLLGNSDAMPKILVAITDGTGRVIARTKEPEKFIGRQVPDWAQLKAVGDIQGHFRAMTIEGRPIVFGFRQVRGTPGWMAVVGEPLAEYNARWTGPVIWLAIVAGAAILFALALVLRLRRLILSPVRSLAERAQLIANGEDSQHQGAMLPPVPPSSVREFETLRQSLASAEAAMRGQAAALALSERRYRSLAEAGALVFWTRDAMGQVRSITGWQEVTGQPDAEALGAGWTKMLHPDDVGVVETAWQKALSKESVIDAEFRIASAAGDWCWVRARGTLLQDYADAAPEWIGVLEDVNERRQAEIRVAHMAHHDALTGLSNRVVFRRKVEETIAEAAHGCIGAIHYIDLDRFKAVNDTLGHAAGDALLVAVTGRLQALVREHDTVARLGGDEFAVIQRDIDDRADISALALRLVSHLSAPYIIDGQVIEIGASVGVTIVSNRDDNPERVLKEADLALYSAKANGRGQHRIFDPGQDDDGGRIGRRHTVA